MGRAGDIATRDLTDSMRNVSCEGISSTDREALQDAAIGLLSKLSSGWQQTWQVTVADPIKLSTMRTIVEMDFLDAWHEHGWEPMTAHEIAKLCRVQTIDLNLLTRVLDAACAFHLLERQEERYSPGHFDWARDAVRQPDLKGAILGFVEWTSPLLLNLPRFLLDSNFSNPSDGEFRNYSHLYKHPGAGIYHSLAENPRYGQGVNDFMQANTRNTLTPWTAIFPMELLAKRVVSGQTLVVDVGGGYGQDLRSVIERQPDLPRGSLVLQDLPHVVSAFEDKEPSGIIIPQPYDFNNPQPVRGASFYYCKNVLHNLSNEQAIKMLRHQATAMNDGSRMLIYERIKPTPGEPGTPGFGTHATVIQQDLFMMAMFSAQERSLSQYNDIVKAARMEIVEVHAPKPAAGSQVGRVSCERVIEARLLRGGKE